MSEGSSTSMLVVDPIDRYVDLISSRRREVSMSGNRSSGVEEWDGACAECPSFSLTKAMDAAAPGCHSTGRVGKAHT
jgi:hypothetical protein